MQIQESGEMYLETIYRLSKEKNNVRAIDVGEHMGYSKPSVSRAMGLLKKGEFITASRDGGILLTEKGRAVAEKIYERHTIMTNLLIALGVDPTVAAEDACKLEHAISDASFEAIKAHLMKYGMKGDV
jgi:Mn-dependent DtxR family transcriptional regulator